jgi:nitrite reductase/ring-hydroxylating ferredoxin subunit
MTRATPGARVVLGDAEREQIARGRFVRVGPGPETFLVGRTAEGWRAYRNVCRHHALPLDLLARTPMSDDGRYLLCHQHGALYRLGDGKCVSGPCAGESLESVTVREEKGVLVLGEA